jgi:hypothetical protein
VRLSVSREVSDRRPLALALIDMGVELGEAGCCVLLAWAV